MSCLFKLNLDSFFASPPRKEEDNFSALARYIGRRLDTMIRTLDDKGLCFEAGRAEEIAEAFRIFADDDGSCYAFSKIWDELVDWGDTSVTLARKEKELCSIPSLPLDFSC